MIWKACLLASFACLCTGYAFALRYIIGKAYKTGNALYPAFMGVISASVFIFIPIFNGIFAGDAWSTFKCIMISIHSAIRLFMVDGEFTNVRDAIEEAGITSGALYKLYTSLAAILFVNAPLLTFGFIFSFLRKLNDNVRYMFGVRKHCYVFSDLNERSITLAENLHENEKKSQIVFTDVFQKHNEESIELDDRAEKIGAVCLNKDILVKDFSRARGKDKNLYFFIMGNKRSENLTQALNLIDNKNYRNRDNTRLFYFSDDENSDLQFSSVDKGKVKVKRVNMARVVIDRMLYEEGYTLFEEAKDEEEGDLIVLRIRAVIVGLGRHGSNMLKALSWFCQMDGYELEIDAFDMDPLAEEKLKLMCPDLLSGKYNGQKDPEEAVYTINIHPGMNVETSAFADEIAKLPKATFIVVSLGDDERNLRTAVTLRMLYERMGEHPQIRAILYNSDERNALKKAENHEKTKYDIGFFGDMRESYSEDVIINSRLEAEALQLHKGWSGVFNKLNKEKRYKREEEAEKSFWDFEYNYRSSVATAIHQKAVRDMEEKGIYHYEIDNEEHRRWNAYMRSEGYIHGGSFKEKNHMAKTHGDLVSNDVLWENKKEFEKDKRIKEALKTEEVSS